MALSVGSLTNLIQSNIAFTGEAVSELFDAIAKAVVEHIQSNAIVSTIDTGSGPASGTPTGIGTISGLSEGLLKGLFIQNSTFTGVAIEEFWTGLASSVTNHIISSGVVQTTHAPSVAVGTGVGSVSGLVSNVLTQQIIGNTNFTGIAFPEWANTIATSIVNHITTNAIVNVVITGVPQGIQGPSSGSGTGIIL